MQFEGTYSASDNHRAGRSAHTTTAQLSRTDDAQPTFGDRLARHIFKLLDADFMAERSQRASRSSRLAFQPIR